MHGLALLISSRAEEESSPVHYLEACAALWPLSCVISAVTLQHSGIVVFAAGAGGCPAPAACRILQLLPNGEQPRAPQGLMVTVTSERLQPRQQRWMPGMQEGRARYHLADT